MGTKLKHSDSGSMDTLSLHKKYMMTTDGFKLLRELSAFNTPYSPPTSFYKADDNVMGKYKPRPKTAPSSSVAIDLEESNTPSTKSSKTPRKIPPAPHWTAMCPKDKPQPRPQSSLLPSRPKPPTVDVRKTIFSIRNAACTPENRPPRASTIIPTQKRPSTAASNSTVSSRSSMKSEPLPRSKSADVAYRFHERVTLPSYMKEIPSPINTDELDNGQKQYLFNIAKIYSQKNMKIVKQKKIQSVLDHEFSKRAISHEMTADQRIRLWKEYTDYQTLVDNMAKNHKIQPSSSRSSSRCRAHTPTQDMHSERPEIVRHHKISPSQTLREEKDEAVLDDITSEKSTSTSSSKKFEYKSDKDHFNSSLFTPSTSQHDTLTAEGSSSDATTSSRSVVPATEQANSLSSAGRTRPKSAKYTQRSALDTESDQSLESSLNFDSGDRIDLSNFNSQLGSEEDTIR